MRVFFLAEIVFKSNFYSNLQKHDMTPINTNFILLLRHDDRYLLILNFVKSLLKYDRKLQETIEI